MSTNWAASCRAHPGDGKLGMEDCTSLGSTMTSLLVNDDTVEFKSQKGATTGQAQNMSGCFTAACGTIASQHSLTCDALKILKCDFTFNVSMWKNSFFAAFFIIIAVFVVHGPSLQGCTILCSSSCRVALLQRGASIGDLHSYWYLKKCI